MGQMSHHGSSSSNSHGSTVPGGQEAVVVRSEHYQTMSIASSGPATLPDQIRPAKPFQIKDTNNVKDIDGASSSVPYFNRYLNKPVFSSADVPGSTSRPLTHSRNVRDMTLYIDDIDGTRHSIKDRMMRTKRHVNPLVPEYDLPSSTFCEIPEPKFLRDSMYHADVEGSTSKPAQKFKTRDNISTDDIVGAQASWRPRHEYVHPHPQPSLPSLPLSPFLLPSRAAPL